jgi:hypothetical protein
MPSRCSEGSVYSLYHYVLQIECNLRDLIDALGDSRHETGMTPQIQYQITGGIKYLCDSLPLALEHVLDAGKAVLSLYRGRDLSDACKDVPTEFLGGKKDACFETTCPVDTK